MFVTPDRISVYPIGHRSPHPIGSDSAPVHDTQNCTAMSSSRDSSPSRNPDIPTTDAWQLARRFRKEREARLAEERKTVVQFLSEGGEELQINYQLSDSLQNELNRTGYSFTQHQGQPGGPSNYIYVFSVKQ